MAQDDYKIAGMMGEATIDAKAFRRRVLFKHVSTPWLLAPFLISLTLLAAVWTFGIEAGVALFAGVAGVLLSFGGFFTRLLLGSETINQQAAAELVREARASQEKTLDALDARLQNDGDPRTEACLRDLRTFAKAFQEERLWTHGVNAGSIYSIVNGVEDLFSQSVAALERSVEMIRMARSLATPQARRPILAQREDLIQDVGKSIQQLGRILAELQRIGGEGGEDMSKLASIREELDQSLEVARRVDRRMNQLSRDLEGER